MIQTPLHGKRTLVDTYFTFLSYILILTQLFPMKVTHREQIRSLFRTAIFMIQAMVKTKKLVPFLTAVLSSNPRSQVKTLRPLQTYITTIVPHEQLSQIRTLKLHINLCNKHHRSGATTFSTLEIDNPTTAFIPQIESSHSGGNRYNLCPHLNPKYSEK